MLEVDGNEINGQKCNKTLHINNSKNFLKYKLKTVKAMMIIMMNPIMLIIGGTDLARNKICHVRILLEECSATIISMYSAIK